VETVETLSWSPRAFLFRGLLTPAECDHIIEIGTTKSPIFDLRVERVANEMFVEQEASIWKGQWLLVAMASPL
jgi:hypothetical protein